MHTSRNTKLRKNLMRAENIKVRGYVCDGSGGDACDDGDDDGDDDHGGGGDDDGGDGGDDDGGDVVVMWW